MNEFQYFQLLYSNEIINLLVEESNNYYRKLLIDTFGHDYKKLILTKNSTSSLPFLFITKGITRDDMLAFIGIRIYMGLNKLPSIKDYWNGGKVYKTIVNKITIN